MKTWVRKTLSVGVLAAGALLFTSGAAHAGVSQDSSDNNGILNGTQLVAPVSVPLNVVGNAIGVAGEANAAGAGSNWTEGYWGGVSQSSSDNNGIANGTQAYLPISIPVNVVGNAVGVLGEANAAGVGTNGGHMKGKKESARTESSKKGSGVWQNSSDNNGILNGTQIFAPIDVPINICGNSLALLGEANSAAMCSNGGGWWTEGVSQDSSDNNGIANGTQVYAPISTPLNIAGNAIGVAGEANAAGVAHNESGVAGKGIKQDSSDNNGILNGTQIAAPVHIPVNVCGNALSILGEANAAANCSNGGGVKGDHDGDAGDNGDDDYVKPDGGTKYGSHTKSNGGRTVHGKSAAATEASPVAGLTQGLTNAGGMNVGGLNLLDTLR
jgi:hypothetical protein